MIVCLSFVCVCLSVSRRGHDLCSLVIVNRTEHHHGTLSRLRGRRLPGILRLGGAKVLAGRCLFEAGDGGGRHSHATRMRPSVQRANKDFQDLRGESVAAARRLFRPELSRSSRRGQRRESRRRGGRRRASWQGRAEERARGAQSNFPPSLPTLYPSIMSAFRALTKVTRPMARSASTVSTSASPVSLSNVSSYRAAVKCWTNTDSYPQSPSFLFC